MNKALQYAEKYSKEGGIDYIDSILGPFTGRGMTPIETVDFVGLDVHKAIVDNIQMNTHDYDNSVFILPEYVNKQIEECRLGRKTKDGLFKMEIKEDTTKQLMVYDIETKMLRPVKKYGLAFAKAVVEKLRSGKYDEALALLKADKSKEAVVCKYFLVSYITYGITTAEAVSPKVTDADIAMTTGFNWIGPVALMQALGGYEEVLKITKEVDFEGNLLKQLICIKEENKGSMELPFDYRKSFRAIL